MNDEYEITIRLNGKDMSALCAQAEYRKVSIYKVMRDFVKSLRND